MKIIEKIKNMLSKKKSTPEGYVYSEILYMNDYIFTISTALGFGIRNINDYEERVQFIINNMKYEKNMSLSNIVMYVKISKDITLIPFLYLCKDIDIKMIVDDKDTHLLLGGSISAFKEIFRRSSDLNNKILLSIKEQLYQIECVFFEDFIKDGLMKRENFLNYNNYEDKISVSYNEDGITFLEIDDINCIICKLQNKGLYDENDENKYNFRSIIELLTIVTKMESVVNIMPYKDIYRPFNAHIAEAINKIGYDYVRDSNHSPVDNVEELFKPRYKELIEYSGETEQKEFYEDVDEIVEYKD